MQERHIQRENVFYDWSVWVCKTRRMEGTSVLSARKNERGRWSQRACAQEVAQQGVSAYCKCVWSAALLRCVGWEVEREGTSTHMADFMEEKRQRRADRARDTKQGAVLCGSQHRVPQAARARQQRRGVAEEQRRWDRQKERWHCRRHRHHRRHHRRRHRRQRHRSTK